MKYPLNGSHIDLDEISMIGPMKKTPDGSWVFGAQWKRTGHIGNIDLTPSAKDQTALFLLDGSEPGKPAAVAAYKAILTAWYGKDVTDLFVPVSEITAGGPADGGATAIPFSPN